MAPKGQPKSSFWVFTYQKNLTQWSGKSSFSVEGLKLPTTALEKKGDQVGIQ